MEDSLNLGVGMVGVVGSESADEVLRLVRAAGVGAWVLGTVSMGGVGEGAAGGRVISGTKGVTAGAVRLHGSYRTA